MTHHSAASPASQGWSARAGAGRSARTAQLQTCAPALATGANGRHVANTIRCSRGRSRRRLQLRHLCILVHLHSGSLPLSHRNLRMSSTTRQVHAAVQAIRRMQQASGAHLLVKAAQRQGLAEHEVHLRAQARKDACDWMASEVQWLLKHTNQSSPTACAARVCHPARSHSGE